MTTPSDEALAAAAILHAKRAGCTCSPDVTITRSSPLTAVSTVAHDADCPLHPEAP